MCKIEEIVHKTRDGDNMLKIMKGKVVLLVLPFVFSLNANGVMAQDDRVTGQKGCVVPTVTGNVDKPGG